MSILPLALALLLGAAAVFQASLNRQIAVSVGLPAAALLNATVLLLIAALGFSYALTTRSGLPGEADALGVLRHFSWWWCIPGMLGFALVMGLPYAVSKIGALNVFVAVVAAQMVTSLLWDTFVEGVQPSGMRAVGALLTVAGVLLVSWK